MIQKIHVNEKRNKTDNSLGEKRPAFDCCHSRTFLVFRKHVFHYSGAAPPES